MGRVRHTPTVVRHNQRVQSWHSEHQHAAEQACFAARWYAGSFFFHEQLGCVQSEYSQKSQQLRERRSSCWVERSCDSSGGDVESNVFCDEESIWYQLSCVCSLTHGMIKLILKRVHQ